MILSYQYRLYPKEAQIQALNDLLEQARQLYNAALEERREAWLMVGVSLNYVSQANQLKEIRIADPDGLGKLNFSACQQILRRLEKSFSAFFRRIKAGEKPGFPRFKSRSRFRSLEFRFGDGASLKGDRLRIQGVGEIRAFFHRPIPEDAKIKAAVVRRDSLGQWFATFQLEVPDSKPEAHSGEPVGIDLGVTTLVALSTGELIEAPRHFRKTEKKLRRQQRRLSRRKKFSLRWHRARKQVAKTHRRITNQRKDFSHKLSRRLVNEFSLVAVEDLNVNGLSRSKLAKSIHDAGWSQLLAHLSFKAESAGSKVVAVDPRYTSQICSDCGSLVPKKLSVRVHRCPECGLVIDRDHNAAINILHRALLGPDGASVRQRIPAGTA